MIVLDPRLGGPRDSEVQQPTLGEGSQVSLGNQEPR